MGWFDRQRKTRLLLGCLGVVGVGAIAAIGFQSSATGSVVGLPAAVGADAGQIAKVKQAFSDAMQADRAATAPEQATSYGKLAAQAADAGQVAPPMSATDRDQHLQQGLSSLQRHFTPAQAQHEAAAVRNAVDAEKDQNFRNLGAGVSKIDFIAVSVSGTSATLEAHVAAWAKFQQRGADGSWTTSNPTAVMDYKATMTIDSSGNWLVSSLVGDFVPGQGP